MVIYTQSRFNFHLSLTDNLLHLSGGTYRIP